MIFSSFQDSFFIVGSCPYLCFLSLYRDSFTASFPHILDPFYIPGSIHHLRIRFLFLVSSTLEAFFSWKCLPHVCGSVPHHSIPFLFSQSFPYFCSFLFRYLWVLFLSPPRWPSGKASASRAEDPGFESRLRRDFFGVESYQ